MTHTITMNYIWSGFDTAMADADDGDAKASGWGEDLDLNLTGADELPAADGIGDLDLDLGGGLAIYERSPSLHPRMGLRMVKASQEPLGRCRPHVCARADASGTPIVIAISQQRSIRECGSV